MPLVCSSFSGLIRFIAATSGITWWGCRAGICFCSPSSWTRKWWQWIVWADRYASLCSNIFGWCSSVFCWPVRVLVIFSIDNLAQRQTSLASISSWLHLSCFAALNYLYAYSLPSLISTGLIYRILFTVAIGSHVLLSDRFLVIHHPKRFRQCNRWIGSSALVLGLLHADLLHPISDLILAFASAFLGGSLVMTVFREELPAANSTRLLWFLVGSGGMVILLIVPMLRHP